MFASDYDRKNLGGSFIFTVVLEVAVFLLIFGYSHKQKMEDYKLTEITMLEEVPDEKPKPVMEVEKPKKMMDMFKQLIPIKQNNQIELSKPKALDLQKPEMNMNKPQALSLDKSKMDALKPNMKTLDLDNEIGQKKISPAMVQQQKLAIENQNKLAAAPSKLNLSSNAPKTNSFLPSSRPAISAAAMARGGGGLKTVAPKLEKPTPAPKKAADENIVIKKDKGTALLITGQLSGRGILKRTSPSYPRWAEEQGIEAQVAVAFTVRADGSVKDNLYIEKTSGYPEIDDIAKEALQQFLFAPLSSSEDQSGTAIFVFKLSR
jgi:TonB family protein